MKLYTKAIGRLFLVAIFLFAQLPGLVSLIAYGGRHRIVLQYDPQKVTPDQITAAIEQSVMTRQGPMAFFKVLAVDVK